MNLLNIYTKRSYNVNIKLNTVQQAQIELVLEKLAAEHSIKDVNSVHIAMTAEGCTIKYATFEDDKNTDKKEKGTFETLGGQLGTAAGMAGSAALVADDGSVIGVLDDPLIPLLPGLGEKGGEFIGKNIDDLVGSDEDNAKQEEDLMKEDIKYDSSSTDGIPGKLLDAFASEDIDFTKFATLEQLKTADAYSIGKGIGDTARTVAENINPFSDTWGNRLDSLKGVGSDFISGLTGQPQQTTPEVQGTSIHDQAMAKKTQQSAQPAQAQQTTSGTYNDQLSPESIASIQEQLGVTADGIMGPNTLNAIKQFQQANGLDPDGIVGPLTTAKLNEATQSGSQQDIAAGLPDWARAGYNTQEEAQAAGFFNQAPAVPEQNYTPEDLQQMAQGVPTEPAPLSEEAQNAQYVETQRANAQEAARQQQERALAGQ